MFFCYNYFGDIMEDIINKKRMLIIGCVISGLSVGIYPFVIINFIKGKHFDLFFFAIYTFLMAIILGYIIYEIINYKKRG